MQYASCAIAAALLAASPAQSALSFSGASAAQTGAAQKIPSEVQAFFAGYFRAVEAGDPDGILAFIDSNFIIKWPVGQPISDRGQLRAALASLQQRVRQQIEWGIAEAHVEGNWAWVRSWERPTHFPRAGGEPRTLEGWRLTILRKSGGRWLLHRDTASLNALPSSGR